MIPIEQYRQQIGLFNSNVRVKNSPHPNQCYRNLLKLTLCLLFCLFTKIKLFFSNSLSLNTNCFVLFSQIIMHTTNFMSSEPILSSIISLFLLIICINFIQLLLIYTYTCLVRSTQIFYICITILFKLNKLELFLKFYHYKHLDLLTHGDIHPHPGPPPPLFKFMHWNVNSIPAHNFERISLLQAYAANEKFNLIALTETALKNDIPDEKIEIDGYSAIRCDLPGNDTHGGVLIYHKLDNFSQKLP